MMKILKKKLPKNITGEMNPEELLTEVATYLDNAYDLFGEEKYRYSAEGHISHILSSRLSSRPNIWVGSVIGADEMARMRAYKANKGSIKEYYRKLRSERKNEERILEKYFLFVFQQLLDTI